jgi:hypothetical protein
MATTEHALVRFLAEYETRLNRALSEDPVVDVEATAAGFASCFVAANPSGIVCSMNDEEFRAAIPKGFDFYRSIGTRGMKIASLTVTELDDCHAMAKVRWHSIYRRADATDVAIDFDVIYLFHMPDGNPKIFGYITGDENRALREHGLLSA